MKIRPYNIIKCPFCGLESFDSNAKGASYVGSAKFVCPECGKASYKRYALEASLLSPGRCFSLLYSNLYFYIRIALILIYAIFLGIIIWKLDLLLSVLLVTVSFMLYAAYEIILTVHKKAFKDSNAYKKLIVESLERMSDPVYADLVLSSQAPQKDCPYLLVKKGDT